MYKWQGAIESTEKVYKCGYCGAEVAPSRMFITEPRSTATSKGHIYICPHCGQPTFISENGKQTPKARLGNPVFGITDKNVESLFLEARDCTSVGAYTAAVMACRKILMNLAVDKQAEKGRNFAFYVNYLTDKGFIPPQGKQWVDAIRDRGNDANHEIKLMIEDDAKLILHFTEALLRFNYELPSVLEADQQKNNQPQGESAK